MTTAPRRWSSNFAGQWLYLRNLAQVKPDPDDFPEFDSSLRQSFERETELFFSDILRANRPVTELLDAKYTYLNAASGRALRVSEYLRLPIPPRRCYAIRTAAACWGKAVSSP